MKSVYNLYIAILLLTYLPVPVICNAQTVTDKRLEHIIHLPSTKGCIYDLLQMISEKTGYHLSYDSQLIDNGEIRKIKRGNRTIAQAIYEITGKKNLNISVKENYILITSLYPITQTDKHFRGTLLDAESGQPIIYGTIHLQGLSWGTVSNQDGQFMIQIPDTIQNPTLIISHIGYKPLKLNPTLSTDQNSIIRLTPDVVPIQEVIIRMKDPISLLNGMLNQRNKNYSSNPILLTSFYREGIKFKGKLLDLAEGILHIYKPAIQSSQDKEQVKQLGKRRITFRTKQDSLITKISGGIHSCLNLDVITHLPTFLQPDMSPNGYIHSFVDITLVNDQLTNVIHFIPKENSKEHFYEGDIYLDNEDQALVQLQFKIHPDFIKKNTKMLVKQQDKRIKLIAKEVQYTVSYRKWGNTYYINHVRGDLHFKVKKKWFATSAKLHTWFEMATSQVDTINVKPIPSKKRIKTKGIFMDMLSIQDTISWKNFNIIPKEQDLERSINKQRVKR